MLFSVLLREETASARQRDASGQATGWAGRKAQTKRLPALPDVPTVAELGYPGFDVSFWVGFFVPKQTPKAIVDRLTAEIHAATKNPDARPKLEAQGSILVQSPAEFAKKISDETRILADVVQRANIKAD